MDSDGGAPKIKRIDFSQAHFLDHSLWECGRRPEVENGGRRRHVAYAWKFKWQPKLRTWTLCRIGKHRVCEGFVTGTAETFTTCQDCWADL